MGIIFDDLLKTVRYEEFTTTILGFTSTVSDSNKHISSRQGCQIRRFFLVGDYDVAKPGRYYTKFTHRQPTAQSLLLMPRSNYNDLK